MEEPTRTRPIEPEPVGAGLESEPCLEIVAGTWRRPPVALGDHSVIIGRAEGTDLQVRADGVSRKHAKIIPSEPGAYNLVDLGAKNGTFLNGRRIEIAALREGDRIQVGQVVLRFGYANASARTWEVLRPSPRDLLSARELEVAELVAMGLTNAEVGRRLGISRRTVATHLEHAYERLGIHSRAQLAGCISKDD